MRRHGTVRLPEAECVRPASVCELAKQSAAFLPKITIFETQFSWSRTEFDGGVFEFVNLNFKILELPVGGDWQTKESKILKLPHRVCICLPAATQPQQQGPRRNITKVVYNDTNCVICWRTDKDCTPAIRFTTPDAIHEHRKNFYCRRGHASKELGAQPSGRWGGPGRDGQPVGGPGKAAHNDN
jgi:hypothetical protein